MTKPTRKRVLIIAAISFLIFFSWILIDRFKLLQKVAGLSTTSQPGEEIKGLIIPHHELASEFISGALIKVSQSKKPSHVVVFAPNHFNPGSYTFGTTIEMSEFNISYEVIEKFKEEFPETVIDKKLIEDEHGVTIPMRYLVNYFPETRFVPMIFSPFYNEKELEEAADFLTNLLPPDTLYILALDFSHNTTLEEAMARNEESINAIKEFDYSRILEFEDDNLDSPVATIVFLKTMSKLNALHFEVWNNSHAALIRNDPALQGTSYVIGVFR